MNVATILLVVMWVYAAVYFIFLLKDVIAHKDEINNDKLAHNIIISLVANFFDTLGIGSYAIATSAWKFAEDASHNKEYKSRTALHVNAACKCRRDNNESS